MKKFRWGILGTGYVAQSFAQGLKFVPGAELVAIADVNLEGAQRFGEMFGITRRYASPELLVADKEIDAVYMAVPHHVHMTCALQFLKANKPVICEKPLAINARQATEMIDCARSHKVFLMEAMWTRLNPVTLKIKELIDKGTIGDIRMLHCHFGFSVEPNPSSRLFNPAFGGGSLLDVGIYCLYYARMVFGREPVDIAGLATIGQTGVDDQAAWSMRYSNGEIALVSSAIRTNTPHEATIMGTKGMVRVPNFWHADRFLCNDEEHKVDVTGNMYNYEALEVQNCVQAGKIESDRLPLDETLQIIQTMDRIRNQWGLVFPME